MRFAHFWFVGLVWLQTVLANTESIIIDVAEDSYGELVPNVPLTKQISDWTANRSISYIGVEAPAGKYFVRICWPASEPADFELGWEEPFLEVIATRNVVPLKPIDPTVHYTLIASDIIYGLPSDAWNIIKSLLTVTSLASAIAILVWKGVLLV